MSSNLNVLLAVFGVLAVAFACRDRHLRQHRAETPLTVALRKPTPEEPRHKAEGGPGLVQQAAAITPAVGLALTVAASNAVATPTSTPEPTTATITVVPASTPAPDAAAVPDRDIPSMRQALLDRMRAKKTRVSRTVRRKHVETPVAAPPVRPRIPAQRKPPAPAPARIVAKQPTPKHAVAPVTGGVRDRIITYAKSQIGLPYVYGAEQPGVAFDCSGLTQWVFSKVGVHIPRTSQEQYRVSRHVDNPQPGDLVFYLGAGGAYHVGIYYKSGYMIVAPHSGTDVQIESIWGSPVYATVL